MISTAKPAYIYARFSSLEQAKGHSLERQLQYGREFVEQQGWTLTDELVDEGKSAFHAANRAEGSALYEFERQAQEGHFHNGAVLVVENIDRLSRQGAKAAARLIWMLNEAGVDVATWHDQHIYRAGKDTDMMDLFSVIIKAQLAYDESFKKSKRITAVWKRKHQQIADGDKTPSTKKTPHWIEIRDCAYQLIEHRAAILNEIFDDYINGLGEHYIVKKLNGRNEPNWGRGNGWHKSYISKLLTNRRTMGEYILHPRHDIDRRGTVLNTNFYPQAITADKFNRAQAVRATRRKSGGDQQKLASNLFTGVIKCAECDDTMGYVNKGKDKRRPNSVQTSYLQCSSYRRGHSCSNGTLLRYDLLEQAVLDHIFKFAVRDIQEFESPEVTALKIELAESERQLTAKQGQLEKITENLTEVFSKALASKAAELESEIEEQQRTATKLSQNLQVAQGSSSVNDSCSALVALRMALTSDDADIRYASRMKANQALKDLITLMATDDQGRTWVLIHDFAAWFFDRNGKIIDVAAAGYFSAEAAE